MHQLALVANCFSYFSHNLCELLHGIFDEVYLTVIVLLNSIESCPILASYLFYLYIDLLNCGLVLELKSCWLGFQSCQLRLEGWLRHSYETCRFWQSFLAENTQLLHGVEVVFLWKKHLSACLVQALPNIVGLLDQDTVCRRIMLTVQIRRFYKLTEKQISLGSDIFSHIKHDLDKVVYRGAHCVNYLVVVRSRCRLSHHWLLLDIELLLFLIPCLVCWCVRRRRGRILFSLVDLRGVGYMCGESFQAFPDRTHEIFHIVHLLDAPFRVWLKYREAVPKLTSIASFLLSVSLKDATMQARAWRPTALIRVVGSERRVWRYIGELFLIWPWWRSCWINLLLALLSCFRLYFLHFQ